MPDGYTADLPGIQGLATFSRARAADVRAIAAGFDKLPAATEDVFGDAGALPAFTRFRSAWNDELGVIAGGLDELGQKFADSATSYNTIEVHWSHNFQNVMK